MSKVIKPFIKRVGGKTRLLPQIIPFLPQKFDVYVEPFVGGGAMFFHIAQNFKTRLIINDLSPELILTYKVIANHPEELLSHLNELDSAYRLMTYEERKDFFYQTRSLYNSAIVLYASQSFGLSKSDIILSTARYMLLTLTCFKGAARVNKRGEFSQTFGHGGNETLYRPDNLRAVSEILQRTEILCGDFEETCGPLINERTFVYLDPPYRPRKPTDRGEKYTKTFFNDEDQIRLAAFVREIDKRGAKFLLSNSNTPDGFFQEYYAGFEINEIKTKHAIALDKGGRDVTTELLITNFNPD